MPIHRQLEMEDLLTSFCTCMPSLSDSYVWVDYLDRNVNTSARGTRGLAKWDIINYAYGTLSGEA